MPRAAQKAFRVSTDPDAEACDFVEVIESDESLSARILKIANSVYYDRGSGSETIVDAVAVIGTNDLRDLLSASTLSEVFPSQNYARHYLWQHDIAVALAAKHISKKIDPKMAGTAFVAGLMHDIGKLLLLRRVSKEYEQIIEEVKKNGDFCSSEEDMFPFNHTEAGLLIAHKWNFSDDLCRAIRNHHEPWEAVSPRSVTGIVKAADTFVHACGIGIAEQVPSLKERAEPEAIEAAKRLGLGESKKLVQEIGKLYTTERELYSM